MTGYNGANGQISVTYSFGSFPSLTLGITVQLLLNGTWTDITQYVYQRNDIQVQYGRPNETSQIQPASMTLTLDNRAGSFSPKNSSGQFYPWIGRNTQIRVSVSSQSGNGTYYSGYRFWGEVSQWPPQWDVTGNDVYVQVTAGGVLRRYIQGGTIGSALARFYLLKTDVTAPIALWMCEDQSGATQFTSLLSSGYPMTWTGTPGLASDSNFSGTDPLPLISKSVWTGTTGSYSASGPATYSSSGTFNWTCPGAVTSLTSVECWGGGGGGGSGNVDGGALRPQGGGGGGGGEYAKETSVAVTPGNIYTVSVGAGGNGGVGWPNVVNDGVAGGNSSFSGNSVTVIAHGGGGGDAIETSIPEPGGSGGSGSSNSVHFSGGSGGSGINTHDQYGAGSPGFGNGGGGGGSGGSAAAGNAGQIGQLTGGGAGGSSVTGGGAGGAGGPSTTAGAFGGAPGAGGGGGGSLIYNGGNNHNGGNGYAGQVKLSYTSSTTPNNVVVRFLLDIPAAGAVDGATILRAVIASGSLTKIECYYNSASSGKLSIRGYNGSTLEFDSAGATVTGVNGVQLMVSLELAKSGSNLAWKIDTIKPGAGSSFHTASGTYSTATIGAVSQIVVNPAGTITDTCVGAIVLQYAYESLTVVSSALNGHDGEYAADRISRLCAEEGLGFELVGANTDTPLMGPQTDMKFTDLLQQIEDADQGQVFETRDQFGLGYRTRVSLQNQSVALTLNYSAATLSQVPLPQYDDSLTRNDVTLSRINGGSVNTQLLTGALSIQAPPNGVGDYGYSLSVNLHADTQLANEAAWMLTVGTVDEYRFPQVTVNLARSEVQSLFASVPGLRIGDYFQITNPPSWVPSSPVKQLNWGYTETMNAYLWQFALNAVPESPYEGVGLPTW